MTLSAGAPIGLVQVCRLPGCHR